MITKQQRIATTIRLSTLLLLSFIMLWHTNTFAASEGASAMKQMATIMHRLKHFPSPQGKETLKKIIDNKSTSANERTLATAMMNLEHMAIPADKPKLQAIIDSAKATQDEKDLASIILNLNHRPTSADKKRLEQMMK